MRTKLFILSLLAGCWISTALATPEVTTINQLITLAHQDLEALEEQWLTLEHELEGELAKDTGELAQLKLLATIQSQQDGIDREIEEIETLITQLNDDRELILNPPPEPEPVIEEGELEPLAITVIHREIIRPAGKTKLVHQTEHKSRHTMLKRKPAPQFQNERVKRKAMVKVKQPKTKQLAGTKTRKRRKFFMGEPKLDITINPNLRRGFSFK